jgi:LEA14-like dessication related protein
MLAPNGTFTFSETQNFCLTDNTGLNELANNNFIVFPNPGNGIFNVTMKESIAGEFTVNVLDVTGRIVMTKVENADEFSIDMSGAAAGTYTVAIQTSNGTMTKRVVLK